MTKNLSSIQVDTFQHTLCPYRSQIVLGSLFGWCDAEQRNRSPGIPSLLPELMVGDTMLRNLILVVPWNHKKKSLKIKPPATVWIKNVWKGGINFKSSDNVYYHVDCKFLIYGRRIHSFLQEPYGGNKGLRSIQLCPWLVDPKRISR